jgi:predicted RNA-binding Zn-ribbon protein involved in translation (DUF1610 family)
MDRITPGPPVGLLAGPVRRPHVKRPVHLCPDCFGVTRDLDILECPECGTELIARIPMSAHGPALVAGALGARA